MLHGTELQPLHLNLVPPSHQHRSPRVGGPPNLGKISGEGRGLENALNVWRHEIITCGLQRDVDRLSKLVAGLLQVHVLPPNEMDVTLALHYCALTNELNEVCEALISLGCDPFYRDTRGNSVVHYAVRGSNLTFLRYLHMHFGDKVLDVENDEQWTLFHTSAFEGNDDRAYEILNLLEYLSLQGLSIEAIESQGKTPLMLAIQRQSLVLVQWFLSRNANLAHRDYSQRTCLHLSCINGSIPVVRTICQAGAINLLHCEANTPKPGTTALKICWSQHAFLLGLLLRYWAFSQRVLGRMHVFRAAYAWYFWAIMAINALVFAMLVRNEAGTSGCSLVFSCATCFTALFWVVCWVSDPGNVKEDVVPDQAYRCSMSARNDLAAPSPIALRPTAAAARLETTERDCAIAAWEIGCLWRHFKTAPYSLSQDRMPLEARDALDALHRRIAEGRLALRRLQVKVAAERRLSCPAGYTVAVLEANPRRVCLTCRIVKPFRAHHCGDCAHCVHRFDHHCVWVDNCIGQGNQRSFVAFLTSLCVALGSLWVVLIQWVLAEIFDGRNTLTERLKQLAQSPVFWISSANGVVNIVWAGFVGYLWIRTVKSMITNVTFYEYLKRPAHVQRRFGHRTWNCCWDLADVTPLKALKNCFIFCSLRSDLDRDIYPEWMSRPRRNLPQQSQQRLLPSPGDARHTYDKRDDDRDRAGATRNSIGGGGTSHWFTNNGGGGASCAQQPPQLLPSVVESTRDSMRVSLLSDAPSTSASVEILQQAHKKFLAPSNERAPLLM